MRKILLTAVALLSSVVISTSAQVAAPTLYGNLIYNSAWGSSDGDKAGIYKFKADDTGEVALEYKPADGYIYANGGAVYVDGKYYVLAHEPKTGSVQTNILYTYDADTWTLLDKKDAPLGTTANDLTWCPVDNKVYGVFMNSTSSGYVFGTLGLADGSVDVIKALDLSDNLGPMPVMALASSAEGDIYMVSVPTAISTASTVPAASTLSSVPPVLCPHAGISRLASTLPIKRCTGRHATPIWPHSLLSIPLRAPLPKCVHSPTTKSSWVSILSAVSPTLKDRRQSPISQ